MGCILEQQNFNAYMSKYEGLAEKFKLNSTDADFAQFKSPEGTWSKPASVFKQDYDPNVPAPPGQDGADDEDFN